MRWEQTYDQEEADRLRALGNSGAVEKTLLPMRSGLRALFRRRDGKSEKADPGDGEGGNKDKCSEQVGGIGKAKGKGEHFF